MCRTSQTQIHTLYLYRILLWIASYLSSWECVLSCQLATKLPGGSKKILSSSPSHSRLCAEGSVLSLYSPALGVWWFIFILLSGEGDSSFHSHQELGSQMIPPMSSCSLECEACSTCRPSFLERAYSRIGRSGFWSWLPQKLDNRSFANLIMCKLKRLNPVMSMGFSTFNILWFYDLRWMPSDVCIL